MAVKLGGFGSTRSGYDWHERAIQPASVELANAMAPYFEFCMEKFGVQRCMFESNFPVDKASYSYCAIWNAFKRITQATRLTNARPCFMRPQRVSTGSRRLLPLDRVAREDLFFSQSIFRRVLCRRRWCSWRRQLRFRSAKLTQKLLPGFEKLSSKWSLVAVIVFPCGPRWHP